MSARWPPLLRAYALGGRALLPVLRRVLTRKHLRDGGTADRVAERFGRAALPRPDGRLIWVHAVSVGEALSVLGLCRALAEEASVLLTTTSVTSAELAGTRLPEGVLHQFAPIDVGPVIARFLGHWRPDLAILTESEIWPVTLAALDRDGVPVAVVNGRLSEKSAQMWSRVAPGLARAALSRMALVLAQDSGSAARFVDMGVPAARTEAVPSLKAVAERLPVDAEARRSAAAWASRPRWLAASTHRGEEEIVLAAHVEILKSRPDALLILAPRHPNRSDEVADLIRQSGHSFARRSEGETPAAECGVYLADTLGEMGLWFDLCNAVLMAGSLVPGIGGHNPMEPAQFGCTILTGPHVENAEDLYAGLTAEGRAHVLDPTPEALAPAIHAAMDAPHDAAGRSDGAAVEATARRLLALI